MTVLFWTLHSFVGCHTLNKIIFSANQNKVSSSSSNIYSRRSISDGISRSLDVARIKERIDSCKIIHIFRDESLEAGYILNILYCLDKLTEMKTKGQQLNTESRGIEEVFMKSFWEEVEKFRMDKHIESDEISTHVISNEKDAPIIEDDRSLLSNDLSGDMDALLSMAFDQLETTTNNCKDDDSSLVDQQPLGCYEVFQRFASLLNIQFLVDVK